MIITIDGPSGTGKSTVAKGVAKKLKFTFFDTGAMYRSFAWLIAKEGVDIEDANRVQELLSRFQFEIRVSTGGERHYFVSGTDVTALIRTQAISMAASKIATNPFVREEMVKIQRRFGTAVDAVFEGRDMGTVVFPDADLKIFLTAKPKVRAERRYRELIHKFPDLSISFDEILNEIEERDKADTTRAVSPLKKAADAVVIDTSEMTAGQVIDKIVKLKPKRRFPKMKLSYKIVYWMARLFFKTCFRLKIYGLEHFRPGAAIIAPNHTSFYDPPVVSISCPEEVHFLARGSLFEVPFIGWLIKILNSHPVARGSSDASIFRMMVDLLGQGKKLILFPEGQRSKTGELLPLERGLSFLVQKSGCPVIPVYVQGAFEAWPRARKIPKFFGKMAVAFGSPIQWEGGMDKKEAALLLTQRTEEALANLKSWLESGARGLPP
jgi:cytidylate kinase